MDVDLRDADQVAEAVGNIFRENAQLAAMQIVHSALHDQNSKVRLDASKYVIDAATKATDGEHDPLATLVKELYSHLDDVEAAASSASQEAPNLGPGLPGDNNSQPQGE
jgi:3-polyprenyl-4-hydroxybenzoate decarboxylase